MTPSHFNAKMLRAVYPNMTQDMADLIADAVDANDQDKKTIKKQAEIIKALVEAGEGYIGNGHEPTDSDVHQPEKCSQCKLESAVAKAKGSL